MVPLFVRVTRPGCWNLSHLSSTWTSFGSKVGQPRLLSKMSFFLLLMPGKLCSRKSVSLWKLGGRGRVMDGYRRFLFVLFCFVLFLPLPPTHYHSFTLNKLPSLQKCFRVPHMREAKDSWHSNGIEKLCSCSHLSWLVWIL